MFPQLIAHDGSNITLPIIDRTTSRYKEAEEQTKYFQQLSAVVSFVIALVLIIPYAMNLEWSMRNIGDVLVNTGVVIFALGVITVFGTAIISLWMRSRKMRNKPSVIPDVPLVTIHSYGYARERDKTMVDKFSYLLDQGDPNVTSAYDQVVSLAENTQATFMDTMISPDDIVTCQQQCYEEIMQIIQQVV